MSRLPEIQGDVQALVMSGAPAAFRHVVGDERASARERLDVYYQAYRLRLLEVLRKDFAGLAELLGEAAFRELFIAYLGTHPSAHPSVRWVGRELASFVEDQFPERPELAEMARFEWAWGLAFDAADADPVSLQAMGAIQPDQWSGLRFDFHPSLQRLELHANVPEIFLAFTANEPLPETNWKTDAQGWAVWRQGLTVKWRSLPPDEAWGLDACDAGEDFAGLCAGLCRWHDAAAVPLKAAELIRQWLGDGLVTRIIGA